MIHWNYVNSNFRCVEEALDIQAETCTWVGDADCLYCLKHWVNQPFHSDTNKSINARIKELEYKQEFEEMVND